MTRVVACLGSSSTASHGIYDWIDDVAKREGNESWRFRRFAAGGDLAYNGLQRASQIVGVWIYASVRDYQPRAARESEAHALARLRGCVLGSTDKGTIVEFVQGFRTFPWSRCRRSTWTGTRRRSETRRRLQIDEAPDTFRCRGLARVAPLVT
jgi:hypothetical protein